MTFFSRCDVPQRLDAAPRPQPPRAVRLESEGVGFRQSLADFVEEIGILVRYAAGLDYYGRGRLGR